MPCSDSAAQCASHHPATQECASMEGHASRGELTQRSPACLPAAGSPDLEEVERVPPTQPGGDEDELLQTTGRAGHGQDVRASGDGVAHPRGAAQPIQPTRAPGDSGLGVSPSGVGVMPSPTGVVQQGRWEFEVTEIKDGAISKVLINKIQ